LQAQGFWRRPRRTGKVLLEAAYDIRTIQELIRHSDVSTTMIHAQVLKGMSRLLTDI